jgi:peptide-methionine (S)-S-oxide reductase
MVMIPKLYILVAILNISIYCNQDINIKTRKDSNSMDIKEKAVFGSGCFWCTEAIFEDIKGVVGVRSGYTGGKIKNPTYKEVCSGLTGHAEAVEIIFNPKLVSYEFLLSVFFKTHDPTSLNSQGNDHGTQYRSVIFYTSEQQRISANDIISKLNAERVYDKPIVTEVIPLTDFYEAEDYHQDYFKKNPGQGYCQFVVKPKVEKFRKVFKEYLK